MNPLDRRASPAHVAVVIPCFKVGRHIERVIRGIPDWVRTIVCVDDCCPEGSGLAIHRAGDPRVVFLRHDQNQGVGAAVCTGYEECLRRGADIIVKMDGDDQMDPAYLATLLAPLLEAKADYAKGNRWADEAQLADMPAIRRFGNLGLSFAVKAASGYWHVFDPCNGYTAVRTTALRKIPLSRLARDYYFETSMLVQLNVIGAVVEDVPIPARYGDEQSSLRIGRILCRFPGALLTSFFGRVWRRHFVRDFGPVATFLAGGLLLALWGLLFGGYHWAISLVHGTPSPAGTVMLAALPFLMGFQMLSQAAVMEMTQRNERPICHAEALHLQMVRDDLSRRAA